MTSLALSLWIALGIALQLAIFLGIGAWHQWKGYQTLRRSACELDVPMIPGVPVDAEEALVAAWTGFRTFRVERKVFEDAAQSVCSFYLVAEDGHALPPYLPGQFLTFRLDVPAAAGGTEPIVRCYSLSDAPRSDGYRISIKRVPASEGSAYPLGRSSSFFHDQVEAGSLLQARAPAGHFHIDGSIAPVVLIGGGIGITPMLSMLNWTLAQPEPREIWLFYGVHDSRELVMRAHLETLAAAHPNFRLHLCFSAPQPEDVAGRDYRHKGRIDIDLLRMQLPIKPYHFYICGPSPMLESLVPALEDWGVPEARIHFEAFGSASIKRRSARRAESASEVPVPGIAVNFSQSGKQLPWTPATDSLLELAEANGISVNSGCRGGACGSCQTTILAGEVIYRQQPDFDPEPGTCLLCACAPKTSLTLEA